MSATPSQPLRIFLGPRPALDFEDRSVRLGLSPIARAQWDDRQHGKAALDKYGPLLASFRETTLADADLAVLPWNWENIDPAEALAFIDAADHGGKRTVVIAGTDFEPLVRRTSAVLFHLGPQATTRRGRSVFAIPYFFTDRFVGDFGRTSKTAKPIVGFCGQVSTSRQLTSAARIAQRTWWSVRRRIGTLPFNPPPVRGHLRLRSRAIRRLTDHPGIDGRFVLRDKYRAGANSENEWAVTSADFDRNLLESDYAVCVRGTGNFSARFFEAMSFGRIPVFVNTDCVLPYHFAVDWHDLLVWVEAADVDTIADKVIEYHDKLSDEEFVSRKHRCRQLWEERLSSDGFFSHFAEHIR